MTEKRMVRSYATYAWGRIDEKIVMEMLDYIPNLQLAIRFWANILFVKYLLRATLSFNVYVLGKRQTRLLWARLKI